jgi:aldehyde:ferredoxin oxidoreductase
MAQVYAGKIMRIDLEHSTWKVEAIPEEWYQTYTLGSGLAAKIFYDEMDASVDALDPRAPLFFFNGLLTGTGATTANRMSVCGRSPLTGIWSEANAGGYWGPELRFAGYDGLIITGRADKPTYVWITEKNVEFRDASHLWSKTDSYETLEVLTKECDPKCRVACIGAGGENGVLIAGVALDGQETRMAGRGGMGAVMGSKNLKAIAVRGTQKVVYHDKGAFLKYVQSVNNPLKDNNYIMSLYKFGTAGGVAFTEKTGDIPIKNWSGGNWFEGAQKIQGQTIRETIYTSTTRCFACPIACTQHVEVKDGEYAPLKSHGPEYETLALLGANCLVDDLAAISKANDLCNRYGLDTISTGSSIAFAMEAYERGILTREMCDGRELTWGNGKAVVETVDDIAHRRGFLGNLLADGTRKAAERLGHGAEEFAVHVKGLEVPAHDPRAFVSMASNYATGSRGACHLESLGYWPELGIPFQELGYKGGLNPHTDEGKAAITFNMQNFMSLMNPLGLCKFTNKGSVGPAIIAKYVNLALGWNWDVEEFQHVGERLVNLKRMINARYGITAKDDKLPPRLLQPRPSGGAAGIVPDVARQVKELYRLRGWDEDGRPTEARLAALGLAS